MRDVIERIEKETKVSNLKGMPWNEIVDKVVLPKMAGPKATRWCINDMFMNLMADYGYCIYTHNNGIGNVLFEIALQRLSCGAVIHGPISWHAYLPAMYWDYSSVGDENYGMTQGCYNFIMKSSEACLQASKGVRNHTLQILFGLLGHISPSGKVSFVYDALGDFKKNAVELYAHAKRLVEYYANFDELYEYYATPDQWEKHKDWFSQYYEKINWSEFFEDTQCLKGNFIQKFFQRRAIKKEIKKLSLLVAK